MFITAVSIVSLLFAEGTHVAGRTTGMILDKLDLMQAMGDLEGSAAAEGSGYLVDGEAIGVNLRLPPNQTYQVIGICDDDCTDVDMWAADGAGGMLTGDVEPEDYAVFPIVVPASGRVSLVISMAECTVNPCAYGYRLLPMSSGW